MDRISELSDSILHTILCHLPQPQAIQTSVLSKSWRHVGPTRPKLEFRESDFRVPTAKHRREFLNNIYNVLQRYNRQNLSVQEVVLEMSPVNNSPRLRDVLINQILPMVLTNSSVKIFHLAIHKYAIESHVIFQAEFFTELHLKGINITGTATNSDELFPIKNLKTLSLDKVRIPEAILEKLIRSCPLIERVILSRCMGSSRKLFVVPSLIFQSEFLSELRLCWCNLNSNDTQFLIKRLKTLFLELVVTTDETLEKIIRSSPLIQCIHVFGRRDRLMRTININKWHFHNKFRRFLHLKSLHLHRVIFPAESFHGISSGIPALQDLELKFCYGFKEIQLTLCSLKRLVIITDSYHLIDEATIYAPSICYFELMVHSPPRLTFYTEDACREWKSRITVVPFYPISSNNVLPWLLRLSRLLNALRKSQISLDVSVLPWMNLTLDGTNDDGFCKHVAVEHVDLTGAEHCQKPPSFPAFLNCLFLLCRPRCISMSYRNWWEHTENKLAEYIIHKVTRKQGEMSSGYFWEQDLEEGSMEFWDDNLKEWIALKSSPFHRHIRFQLKWIER